MRKDLGAIVPLIRLLRPVVTWFFVRSSPYLKENRRVVRREDPASSAASGRPCNLATRFLIYENVISGR